MRALIDTNVLMDFLVRREPFFDAANRLVSACAARRFDGYIAAHSILNLFFILRHDYTPVQRRAMLTELCFLFHVVSVDGDKILSALKDERFLDFEDCVQSQCAISCHVDYIITRNERDFSASIIPAISPDVFCARFLISGGDANG